jgi:outer membrane phospholipase A
VCGAAFVLLVGLSAPRIVLAQDVTPVFVVPKDPVTAGGPLSVWLAVLNASDRAVTYVFPASLDGRLRVAGADRSVSATLRNTSDAGGTTIPPGGYVRREYVMVVPEGLEGQAVLSVPAIAANAVALDVRQAEAVARAAEAAPTEASKTPAAPPKAPADEAEESAAVEFFKEHFSGYEPLYFVAGGDYPNAKFQISFKYQLFSNTGPLVKILPAVKGLHIAYTQTSLWDLTSTSKPFVDTSYKPEVFYVMRRVDGGHWADWLRLDLQAGLQHQSNGKSGADSRSLNVAYFEPTLVVGDENRFHFSLAPRIWAYVGGLDENPDIKDYYGNVGVRSTLGWGRGLLLSATGRLGDDANRGSIQLDLSYPLMRFLYGNVGLYLYAQYFLGYGESLLRYNERSSALFALRVTHRTVAPAAVRGVFGKEDDRRCR